jgi:hypothetical protein
LHKKGERRPRLGFPLGTGKKLGRSRTIADYDEWAELKQPLFAWPEHNQPDDCLALVELPDHSLPPWKRRKMLQDRASTTTPILAQPDLESKFGIPDGARSALVPGPRWTRFFGGGRWVAINPWRSKIDVPRAMLEFARAGIGYIL